MSSHLHEKPSMEEMQLKLIEILTVGHETLDDEHDELVADITGIQAFLARPAKEVYSLIIQYTNNPKSNHHQAA